MAKRFDLDFKGYWSAAEAAAIPAEAGVLCVYARDTREAAEPGAGPGTMRVIRIQDCLSARDAVTAWLAEPELSRLLIEGEAPCFSFAPLLFGREQAAAALIYQHKPIGNHDHKYSFRHEPTQVNVKGQAAKLRETFLSPDPEDKDISHLLERLGLSMSA